MKRSAALIPLLLLCIGAAPNRPHPLQLVVPGPDEAVRLAAFKTYPDETVVEKVKSLERVAREANPDARQWSIYLTPDAATVVVKGWKEDLDRPDTPLPQATLGQCLDWLCRRVPDLQYENLDGRILIDVKKPGRNDPAAVDAPGTKAGANSGHASMAAYPDAVVVVKDTATGITASVEPNGQDLKAVDKDGAVLWKVNLIKVWGRPSVGAPVIRHLEVVGDQVRVTIGKHMYGEVDLKTGKAVLRGED